MPSITSSFNKDFIITSSERIYLPVAFPTLFAILSFSLGIIPGVKGSFKLKNLISL